MDKLTVGDILQWEVEDFNLLNKDELKQVLSVTRNAARKRVKRIEKSAYGSSVATTNYNPENYRNMSMNKMRRELKKDLQFLTDKTSTLSGVKEVHGELNERLNKDVPEEKKTDLAPEDLKGYWDAYNKLKEDPAVNVHVRGHGSDQLQQMLASVYDKDTPEDDIISRVKADWVGEYETSAETYAENDPFNPSNFYTVESVEEYNDDEVYS